MPKWSEEAARKSNERQEANKQHDAISLQKRSVLDNKGRALWSDIRHAMGRKCEEFNAEPGNMGTLSLHGNQSEVTVCITMGQEMIVGTYSDDTVIFAGKNGVRYAVQDRVKLSNDGLDVWLCDGSGFPVDIETLANEVIEVLLKASGR